MAIWGISAVALEESAGLAELTLDWRQLVGLSHCSIIRVGLILCMVLCLVLCVVLVGEEKCGSLFEEK